MRAIPFAIESSKLAAHFSWTVITMINRESIDDIAQRIGDLFGRASLPHDLQQNLRAVIQSGLSKMDVVTRDEFEAQTLVLEHTRAKLDQLERQLDELTQQIDKPKTP